MVQLRAATEGDTEAIVRLTAAGWRAAYPGIVPDRLIENLPFAAWHHDISAGLRAPVADSFTRIAELDGRITGYCFVAAPGREETEGSRVAELVAIYVEPDRWRGGIGRALLEAAIAEAEGLDYEQLLLWSFETNAPALAFYRGLGFAEDGTRRPHAASGSPTLRLRRGLNPGPIPSQ